MRQFNGISTGLKNKLDKHTSEELKLLASFLNLERSGEKAALVDRIDGFLKSPKDLGESKPSPKPAKKVAGGGKNAAKRAKMSEE